MDILIINGPNLNLLGRREPGIYGNRAFEDWLQTLRAAYPDVEFGYFQSNIEGELIDMQAADGRYDGILLNAGGYTHTSVAIRDAVAAISVPVIEIHVSNVAAREEFRHTSLVGAAAVGTIAGFGTDSYALGIEALLLGKERNERM